MITAKFKRLLQIVFLVPFCLFLCACQAGNTDSIPPEQTTQPARQTLVQAYLPIVADNDIEDAAFSLIYLDDDDSPELVVFDRYYSQYSIYTIEDSSAECLVDSMTTVEMTYYERKNMIATFFRWNGGGDEGGYASAYYQLDQYSKTLTDDFIPSFKFSYNAVYNENGEWTGAGITNYYEKGEEIDEAAYNQIFADFNITQADEVSCFSEDNLCFTKDEILMYINTLE